MKNAVKKITVGLCAAALLAGCAKGGNGSKKTISVNKTGYPVVDEKLEMTMMGVTNSILGSWEDNLFFKEMEKLTNMSFKFNVSDSETYQEKKNLAFASGELPDVFFKSKLSASEVASYGEQGILIPLENLISEYAPNLSKILKERPEIKTAITANDGHIYSLPVISQNMSIVQNCINKSWLDKLGLAEPETADELYTVLKAFKERDPNGNGKADEIPLSLIGADGIKSSLFHAFGLIADENNLRFDDGKVEFMPMDKNFPDAVRFVKRLYDEGLLDSDTFSQTANQLAAKGVADDEVLGMFYSSGAFLQVGESRHFDYTSLIPLKTADGNRIYSGWSGIGVGTFAITNVCKSPEAAVRWVDYLYSEEGGKLVWCGVEGTTYKMNPDGTWDWILKDGEEQNTVRGKQTIQPGENVPHLNPEEFFYKINNKYEASLKGLRGRVTPYAVQPVPIMYFSEADLRTVNSIIADVKPYVNEMIASFVVGKKDIDKDMNEFYQTLKNMRVDELLSIYQKTYDGRK